jgi:hypothetical protein
VSTPSSAGAIADPRAYLQQRVARFTRVLLTFLLSGVVVGFVLNVALDRDPLIQIDDIAQMVISALFGAVWLYTRKGERGARVVRALELSLTMFTATVFSLAIVYTTIPAGAAAMFMWAFTSVLAIILLGRAAIIPSPPLLTLAVGACAAIICTAAVQSRWHPVVPEFHGSGQSIAAIHAAILLTAFVALSAVISNVVHGLQRKVRKAMQLGQYTLEDKIGEGGMGAVYRARHAMLRRPTAIKLLPPEKAGEKAIERFEQEVQLTSRLTHPNTVAIYDFGRTPDGVFYYAMEYLDGVSLDELVELDGPQPAARVLHILAQAAEALAEAHDAGLIHRDIKPANIILCERGGRPDVVKVLDFGLVKDIAAPKDLSLSVTTTITGTPLYLAPESIMDPSAVDGRTDLYALGCVAYFLLTGEPVFGGNTIVEVCGHHMHKEPTPPSQRIGGSVDAELERVVLHCLAKAQDDRPESAQALLDELMACSIAGDWSRADARSWWNDHASEVTSRAEKRREALRTGETALTVAVDARTVKSG